MIIGSILQRIKRIHFIEMSMACLIIESISIIELVISNRPHKDHVIDMIANLLFVSAAPTAFMFGILGIIFNEYKLLAFMTTCVAGVLTFFVYIDFFMRLFGS
jgi:hypothetical protein